MKNIEEMRDATKDVIHKAFRGPSIQQFYDTSKLLRVQCGLWFLDATLRATEAVLDCHVRRGENT